MGCGIIGVMEHIDMRKLGEEGLKQVRSQVVRLKKMGKTGKEIEELTGVRRNRVSEIWTAYQRKGEESFMPQKTGRPRGSGMILSPQEQEQIRKIIIKERPGQNGLPGQLWTLEKARQMIQKRFGKKLSPRSMGYYMKRWNLTCQRPAKIARKQDPKRI